jgi:hypothetical protein
VSKLEGMRGPVSLLLCVLGLVAGVPLHSQTPPQPAAEVVTLTLRVPDGARQFRIGEIIPLELEFASAVSARYYVDGATYDRSGRLLLEQFQIEPTAGTSDPLLDYFAQAAFIGGGLRSRHALGGQPVRIRLELNEWVRFDRPGRYRVSVRSSRVTDESRMEEGRAAEVPVQSNAIEVEVLEASPDWQRETYANARAILDGSGADERRRGCRMLRFLGTEAAVDEMIRRLDSDPGCGFDSRAGLFGAPDRAYVIRRLEERLVAPDQPVSTAYVRTLAALSLYLRHPDFRPVQTAETAGRIVQGELGRRPELVSEEVARYVALLLPALPGKEPAARALTMADALDLLIAASNRSLTAGVRDQLAGAFLDLPLERQRILLEGQWHRMRSPALLPALRHLASAPSGAAAPLFDVALRRLHDLSPNEARPILLREIRAPRRGMTLMTLGILPDRELPELDDALASAVLAGNDPEGLRAGLLARYASDAVAPRLESLVSERVPGLACAPQAALIAYFLRASPASGRGLLDQALAARERTGCYRTVLGSVAAVRMTAGVEEAAVRLLDDPDAEVAAGAAAVLGEHGSAAAAAPLRAAFFRWRAAWTSAGGDRTLPSDEARRELALVEAIGRGQGWRLDAAGLADLRALCVTDGCRRQAEFMIELADERRIRVHSIDEPRLSSILLAQYQFRSIDGLERKLAQFPRGTSFTLDVTGLAEYAARDVVTRVEAAAASAGLRISVLGR